MTVPDPLPLRTITVPPEVTPERAAYDLLRSVASPLPKYTSNALVWLLGAIPGEDVDAHGWAPGAWEELRRRVAREILAMPAPAPAVGRRVTVTDFPGAGDEDAAVRLAHGRQWIAHHGASFLPSWDELTEREREQAITEARHWLMAAVNVGLLPPAREFECPSCRGVIRARAVPAPASAAVTEHAIEMSDGHMRVYIQRQVSMPHMEPERVDAIQWTGRNFAELAATFPEVNARIVGEGDGRLVASVADGELLFKVGWWLIRTHSGYLCAMFPRAFEQRYRLDVSEEAPRG